MIGFDDDEPLTEAEEREAQELASCVSAKPFDPHKPALLQPSPKRKDEEERRNDVVWL